MQPLYALSASLFLTSSIAVALPHGADDDTGSWPQWRGPARDGVSTETDWVSEGKAEDLWARDLGLGYSSVSIHDGHLYTMGYDDDAGEDVIWCLSATTGETIWSHRFEAEKWDKYHGGGTQSTPTVDGDVVFVMNREGNLFSLDAKTGEVHWHKALADEYELELPTWAFAASPLVLGDRLILNVGRVLCLNKADGSEQWVSNDFGHAYSTPATIDISGRPGLAVFNGNGLAIIDQKRGVEVDSLEWKTEYDINAATPIVMGDRIFISSGYNHGCALLSLEDDGLKVLWENKEMKNKMSGSVLIGESLYGFDEEVLKCIDLEGKERWSVRGTGNGALLGSTDRIIFLTDKGELVVAEATPEEYRELSRSEVIPEKGVFWTTPVLVNGLIYCRSSTGRLVCRDHRG